MNKKVLIVEDQFVEANDLQLMLTKAGYEVCGIARSVPIAMEMIKKDRPTLVLLDIFLKGKLTGIDLAKQVENITMVVFVTAERLYNLKGIDLDKSIVLHKPLSRAKFLRASELIKSRLI